ncbi:exopolysaccharide transport family protein [Mucilaginibacter sp. SP1R1]|uniref:exopolysaccharide transport family protein n=1 Tax=Mucilaginibacter sp. SP1R1 TaxID=2723091 RepID=UPI00161F9818|nr:AAA family ATPase [Mucilaginibacter sp. SP1R1]MBB6148718.1 capsular polysaccharide biosynthesis protein/Mrp family chromosome partitioning ATPase [Mucilaginibacter sp. SP1R1]
MEIANFFKLLRKYRNILIIIPLLTVIGSFFLVKNLPNSYISHAQIATGIVDASRHLLDKDDNVNAQEQQVFREFSNLIAIMKLKKLMNQVSYQLIIHDLSTSAPFRKPSKELLDLRPAERDRALAIFKGKLQRLEPLSLYDRDEDKLNDLLISMKYDERSILKDLIIARDEDSDFISVTYDSENPQLSAFIVNVLCKQFIDYYTQSVRQNESTAVNFLSNLLEAKKKALSQKTDELQKYKIQNGVLSLDEQSKAIFGQIMIYNDKKLQAEKDIISYDGAINAINKRFDPTDRKYVEATITKYNQAITSTQDQLHLLEDKYVRSGFNAKYKNSLDSIQNILAGQINQSSDKYATSPLVAKDDLIHQKLTLEISRDLAKYSVKSIDNELASLNGKFSRLVPFDATVKTYDFDIDIAGKEYLDVLNKYNATNLKSNFSIKLIQVEIATPDVAQPSKKILLIALSAVVSIVGCLFVMFILFYLDKSIRDPSELVNRTQLPLLGYLNRINSENLDLKKLWDIEHRDKMRQFKELLRSVRFEVDQELNGEKVLAITSIDETEGKTLLAMSLAYSYSMINKKVLLIDANFNNPTISKTMLPTVFVEDHFKNNPLNNPDINNSTTVLGNRGSDLTLFEIGNEEFIKSKFDDLRSKFDIIIIDTAPLSSLNKSKEWLVFANKTIGVFEAGKSISNPQKLHLAYLRNLHNKFAGWVLNKADFNQQNNKA